MNNNSMKKEKKAKVASAASEKDKEKTILDFNERQSFFHPGFMGTFADEVAKLVIKRMPKFPKRVKKKPIKKSKQAKEGFFLDTSAIIDGRIFDVIAIGIINGVIVVTDTILLELKHIADSKDPIKKERGRKGLEKLEKVKRNKGVKFIVVSEEKSFLDKHLEVDEILIKMTKLYKGKIITCDYNLEKKASVHGVTAINMHAMAQSLKVAAVPGENIQVKVLHQGKDVTQGVGYLDDGTMIVVEKGSEDLGITIDVVVSRVIQTASGKILFARKIV